MTNTSIPFQMLQDGFSHIDDVTALLHAIGVDSSMTIPKSDDSPDKTIARQLAANTILITLDCEHYTLNSSEMTEIGIATLKRSEVVDFTTTGTEGEFGNNILQKSKHYFLRLREKAHLHTSNPNSNGPAGNRFGEQRFVTFEQARQNLRSLLDRTIQGLPALQGHKHPIIILGHAIGHDTAHLKGKDLGLDVDALGTVVKIIDTQRIAKQLGLWLDEKEVVGLDKLVGKLGFVHSDAHTASNDAARTFISGVVMVIPQCLRHGQSRSLMQVVTDFEQYTRNTSYSLGGDATYCCRCGQAGHMHTECTKTKRDLTCNECASRGLTGDTSIDPHITLHCPIKRDEIVAERLEWYKPQGGDWKPKWAYNSVHVLQTYAPNAPIVGLPSDAEVSARLEHYSNGEGPWKVGTKNAQGNMFIFDGRRFGNSPLQRIGAPSKAAHDAPRNAQGYPIIPPGTPLTAWGAPRNYGAGTTNFLPAGQMNPWPPRGGGASRGNARGDGFVPRGGQGRPKTGGPGGSRGSGAGGNAPANAPTGPRGGNNRGGFGRRWAFGGSGRG